MEVYHRVRGPHLQPTHLGHVIRLDSHGVVVDGEGADSAGEKDDADGIHRQVKLRTGSQEEAANLLQAVIPWELDSENSWLWSVRQASEW